MGGDVIHAEIARVDAPPGAPVPPFSERPSSHAPPLGLVSPGSAVALAGPHVEHRCMKPMPQAEEPEERYTMSVARRLRTDTKPFPSLLQAQAASSSTRAALLSPLAKSSTDSSSEYRHEPADPRASRRMSEGGGSRPGSAMSIVASSGKSAASSAGSEVDELEEREDEEDESERDELDQREHEQAEGQREGSASAAKKPEGGKESAGGEIEGREEEALSSQVDAVQIDQDEDEEEAGAETTKGTQDEPHLEAAEAAGPERRSCFSTPFQPWALGSVAVPNPSAAHQKRDDAADLRRIRQAMIESRTIEALDAATGDNDDAHFAPSPTTSVLAQLDARRDSAAGRMFLAEGACHLAIRGRNQAMPDASSPHQGFIEEMAGEDDVTGEPATQLQPPAPMADTAPTHAIQTASTKPNQPSIAQPETHSSSSDTDDTDDDELDAIKLGPDGELIYVPQRHLDAAAPEVAAALRATVKRNKEALEKKRRPAPLVLYLRTPFCVFLSALPS
ncbi:hypothetical protein BDZ90DRAFT_227798 [Jaminaea rosea]|uniref:Uncharacterized protein n=1 Tax=Jaminaea rosea TaxID=1569628 RepID=A0A316UMT9_9BASI|nr:hypothetical protein BDZ90DRAFT_227798 [Jaminaea rosea]PWN26128.1 hypothetical protein BDZ90DRAFT_227798 [Jaminaea rosea]